MVKKQLKVYGTVKVEKRENWKGKYKAVSRDRKGRFKTHRKWSPKKPITKKAYVEKYTKEGTGKEVHDEIKDLIEEEVWIEYVVKSP